MKKTLLSMLACLGLFTASATTTTYVMTEVDPGDITGTYNETTYKADESVQEYANWKPLESLVLGTYTLTFEQGTNEKNGPAFYTAKEGSAYTVRVYNGNTFTVTSTGAAFNQITFGNYNNKGELSASAGAVTNEEKNIIWNGESTNTVTFTVAANCRFETISFSDEGEGGTTPDNPEPEVHNVATVAELNAVPNGEKFAFKGNATVSYQNGPNMYVQDATGAALIYSSKADPFTQAYVLGNVITEMEGTRSDYNTTVEFVPVVSSIKLGEDTALDAAVITSGSQFTTANLNYYVVLQNVDFTLNEENARYALATFSDGTTVTIYNTFCTSASDPKLEFPEAGKYNIYGVGSVYKEEPQLSFIATTAPTDGINSVIANGEVEFFNLNGVRVANPEKGLYIVRQGGKTSKVIIK